MTATGCRAHYRKVDVVSAVYADIARDPTGLLVRQFLDRQFQRTRLPSAVDPGSLARMSAERISAGSLAFRDACWHLFRTDLKTFGQLTAAQMSERYAAIKGDPHRFCAFPDQLVETVELETVTDWPKFIEQRARTDHEGVLLAFGGDPLFVQAIDLAYSDNPAAGAHLVHLQRACRSLRKRTTLDAAARIDLTLCEEIIGSRPKHADSAAALAAFAGGAAALAAIASRGGVIWEVVGAGVPLSCFLDPTDPAERETFLAVRETAAAVLRHSVLAPPALARFSPTSAVGVRTSVLMQRLRPSPDLFAAEPTELALSSFRRLADGVVGVLGESDDAVLLAAWKTPFSIAALAPMSEVTFRTASPGAIQIPAEQGCPS